MQVKISKSDLLQSVGFALTAAEEEATRLRSHIGAQVQDALEQDILISEDAQKELGRALTKARDLTHKLGVIKRMAEFARDDEELFLGEEDFELIEVNLPAR